MTPEEKRQKLNELTGMELENRTDAEVDAELFRELEVDEDEVDPDED
jgi:hypothetical protein